MSILKSVASVSSDVKKTAQKKYKCPYCELRLERSKLPIHIQNVHEDLIPEGYTALRVAFNTINHKTEGHCIICNSVTDWNESKGRYERLCNNPACKEAYKKMCAERNQKVYGTDRLQSDPKYADDVQRKALEGRRISGKYKFSDGGIHTYVGTYEKKFLEFMDKVMECKSEDILSPGPAQIYKLNGEEHHYLPDFYYVPYNLIIEIKDGGSNPNNHPHRTGSDQEKLEAKENAIKKDGKYNYVRVVNNDFSQLLTIMSVLKYNIYNNEEEIVFRVNESYNSFLLDEDMAGTIAAALPRSNYSPNIISNDGMNNMFNDYEDYENEELLRECIDAPIDLTPQKTPYESDKDNYYIIQHPDKDEKSFSYSITKDPVQNTIYSVDPESKGFYKVYKTDKSKINKKYLTFKIKDRQSAKELYDELAKVVSCTGTITDPYSNDNYIYYRLTEGSDIMTPDQLLFDSRFELVDSPKDRLIKECDYIYKYLKPDAIDIINEQLDELETDALYNVLPDYITNYKSLMDWKNRFLAMPRDHQIRSDDFSIQLYGSTNMERFDKKYHDYFSNTEYNDGHIQRRESDYTPSDVEFINLFGESTIEIVSPDNWSVKMQKVKEAESMGLIIMVPDTDEYLSYTEENIAELKKKYEAFQSLPEEKRRLSNQTASNIFGIDNDGLYAQILNHFMGTFKAEKEYEDEYRNHPEEDDCMDIADVVMSTNTSPYFEPGEINSIASESATDEESYKNILREKSMRLERTFNHNKREILKEEILSLGWNPEIPFTQEAASRTWMREIMREDYHLIPIIEADEYLSEMKITNNGMTKNIVPIFVVLVRGVSQFSKQIMKFTNSHWSHASLGIDSSLKDLYSFNANYTLKKQDYYSGFTVEGREKYSSDDPHMNIKVFALFVTVKQKNYIKNTIRWYIEHKDETNYNLRSLLDTILKVNPHVDKYNLVCSQFVYAILKLVNFKINVDPNAIVRPSDFDRFAEDARFFSVYEGPIDKYNQRKVDSTCKKIMSTLSTELYAFDESAKEKSDIDKVFKIAEMILNKK